MPVREIATRKLTGLAGAATVSCDCVGLSAPDPYARPLLISASPLQVGGYDGSSYLDCAERLDPRTDR